MFGFKFTFRLKLVGDVGEKSDVSCALDGLGQLTLMLGAGAGHAAGKDLCALADETAKLCNILVVNIVNLIGAENANLAALSGTCITVESRTLGTLGSCSGSGGFGGSGVDVHLGVFHAVCSSFLDFEESE